MKSIVEPEKFVLELMAQIGARDRRMLLYPMVVGVVIFVTGMFLCLDTLRNQQDRMRYSTSGNPPFAGSINITNGSYNGEPSNGPAPATAGEKVGLVSSGATPYGKTATPARTSKPTEGQTVQMTRPARVSRFPKHAGLTPEEQARVDDNCPFGAPLLGQTVNVPSQLVCRDGYALMHSNIDKIALWVCEQITKEATMGDMERSDHFGPNFLRPKEKTF